jgi:hypothetical protein
MNTSKSLPEVTLLNDLRPSFTCSPTLKGIADEEASIKLIKEFSNFLREYIPDIIRTIGKAVKNVFETDKKVINEIEAVADSTKISEALSRPTRPNTSP